MAAQCSYSADPLCYFAADHTGSNGVDMTFRRFLVLFSMLGALSLGSLDAHAKCGVDVNKASAKDLQRMKGVGPGIAKNIMDFRTKQRRTATKNGRPTWNFQNWASLYKVKGVDKQICAGNIKLVCFSGKVQKSCPK